MANIIADSKLASIVFLVNELGAQGTFEHPAGSYLPAYFDLSAWGGLEVTSTTLHQCRYGRPYKKPTTFWNFNDLKFGTLSRRCDCFLVAASSTWSWVLAKETLPRQRPIAQLFVLPTQRALQHLSWIQR